MTALSADRPSRRKKGGRVLVEFFLAALAFGIANRWTAPWVARVLGQATGHDAALLRLIGWGFGGLPFVVIGVLVFARPLVLARGGMLDVLAVWIATNATVIPRRHTGPGSVAHRLFGVHATDGLPLAFGVAVGLLSLAVAFLGIGLVVKVLRGHGPFQHRSTPLLAAIQTWYFGWLAAGLLVALTVAAPDS